MPPVPSWLGWRQGPGDGAGSSLHCYIHKSQNKRLKRNDSSPTACVPPTMYGGAGGSLGSYAPGIKSPQALEQSNLGVQLPSASAMVPDTRGASQGAAPNSIPSPSYSSFSPRLQPTVKLTGLPLWLPSTDPCSGLSTQCSEAQYSELRLRAHSSWLRTQGSDSGLKTQAQDSGSGLRTQAQGSSSKLSQGTGFRIQS